MKIFRALSIHAADACGMGEVEFWIIGAVRFSLLGGGDGGFPSMDRALAGT